MLVFCGTPFGRELRWGLCTEMVPTKEATATGFRVSEGKCEIFVSRHFQKVGCKWNHVWECQLRCIPVEKRILIVGCINASTLENSFLSQWAIGNWCYIFQRTCLKKPKWIHCQSLPTLLVTNILPPVWHFWADDSPNFPKWDMLVPSRVFVDLKEFCFHQYVTPCWDAFSTLALWGTYYLKWKEFLQVSVGNLIAQPIQWNVIVLFWAVAYLETCIQLPLVQSTVSVSTTNYSKWLLFGR